MALKIGWSIKMKCGQRATIIDIRNQDDIDVQFDDGGIVYNITYHQLLMRGFISPLMKKPPRVDAERVKQEFDKRGLVWLDTEYKSARSELHYFCPKHPECGVQIIKWVSLQRGSGCPKCGYEKVSRDLSLSKRTPFEEIRQMFESQELQLLTTEEEYYVDKNPMLYFICKCSPNKIQSKRYTAFLQRPHCSLCFGKDKREEYRKDVYKKLQQYCESLGYQLISSLDEYKNVLTKIKVKCSKHGIFITTYSHLLEGKGCPYCGVNKSNGEIQIAKFLDKHSIKYVKQKTFDGLKYKNKLRCDFYLPDFNMIIEYQGAYHDGTLYKKNSSKQSLEEYLESTNRDNIKRKYAEDNHIRLLEIWYWDYQNIDIILRKELNIDAQ